MRMLVCCLMLLALTLPLEAQPKTLIEWSFKKAGDLSGWRAANHISDLKIENGALCGRIMNWDPFLIGPQFDIPATPWQRVEVRLKTDCGGDGEIFFTNTTESQYGGFSPGKETHFQIIGDNQWHDYRIYPFWQKEKKIILLRLDLPKPPEEENGKKTFAVEYIRVVDLGRPAEKSGPPTWNFSTGASGWSSVKGMALHESPQGLIVTTGDGPDGWIQSEPIRHLADDGLWVSIEMAVDKGQDADIRWVSSDQYNINSFRFPVIPDGKSHIYNVDMSASGKWSGEILLLGITPSEAPGAKATIRRITVSDEPQGPAAVEASYAGLENAINRTGEDSPFIINLLNRGGKTAADLRIASIKLPPGVTVVDKGDWRRLPDLEPFEPTLHRIFLKASGPVKGPVTITLTGAGAPTEPIQADIDIEASLHLPKAGYVPEPHPVKSDYEIGALYFPGWPTAAKWEPIERVAPIRKPVLGWYDEGNPECVDWQIKWAAENGIKFFLVDWYWSAGNRHLEHWVNAFKKARYRHYLKWAMMWANHNAPGTHSEEDQRKVTQYWIDNYFNMPEYYRIDDKPMVMIWSPQNMERDMAGKGGAKRLLDISQEMAKAAGYKGIYFIAMKWPEASTDPKVIQPLKDEGFSMTSIYHYMDSGGKAQNRMRFPFKLVADSSYSFWESWRKADILPFLPNLATGWDARPWHGDKSAVIYDRTVPLFRKICEDAKRFADETGIKRMVLAPLNEWGEGSYAEPCKQFGFGMYEAVRDTFCKKPAGGWPLNYGPTDVGLGPYDLPMVTPQPMTAWNFKDGSQGWGPLMGIGEFAASDGAIQFVTSSTDPAVGAGVGGVAAKNFKFLIVKMKIDAAPGVKDSAQVFWATTTTPVNEAASVIVPLTSDGEYHTYTFAVGENPRWRGHIASLRFDPCSRSGAHAAIAEMRFSKDGK